METQSAFQRANPLSPRKFAKKMFWPAFGWIFIGAFFSAVINIFPYVLRNGTGPVDISVLHIFLGALAIWAVGVFIGACYYKAYIRRYYYEAGEHFVTIKKGVFAPTEIHVQYAKIQDVYVDQDILDRMLGIYDVHIASATVTSGIEAHIDGVDKDTAERIKDMFLRKIIQGSPAAVSVAHGGNATPSSPSVLASDISSATYPPSSKYLLGSFLGSFLSALFFATVIFGGNGFSLMGFLAIFAACLAGLQIYNIIWFKNYSFAFDKDMIVIRTKVISTKETHVPYRTIQDVVLGQNVFERLLGIATVTIQNATQTTVGRGGARIPNGATLIAQPIAKAKELVEIVRGIIEKTRVTGTGL